MSQPSNDPIKHEELHSDSEEDEHLDTEDHHEDTNEEIKESEDDSNNSAELELEHAHGQVKVQGTKDGYGEIDNTNHDEDESHELNEDDMVKADMNIGVLSNQQVQPDGDSVPPMPIAQQNVVEYDAENSVNVVQFCLEGSFKPFLACVQAGFIDKDYIIDQQINRRVIHLIAHFGNIKAIRVLYEVCKCTLEVKDYQGLNAVHYASGSGEIETLKYLCEHLDANAVEEPDTAGMTPLLHAASKNSVLCFIYLYLQRR
jgi:hypothetical protein